MKSFLLAFLLMLTAFSTPSAQTNTPHFEMWVECVARGPYPGRADANLSYRYDGAFSIMVEDSRYYGDIGTQYIQLMPFAVEPGEHAFAQVSVGALKAVLWKVVLFDELHVLAIWDDPAIADCPWQEAAPTETPDLSNTL